MPLKYVVLTLPKPTRQIAQAVESHLHQWGEPIRWAIIHVDGESLRIEGVVDDVAKG